MRKVTLFLASIMFASAAHSAPPSPESIDTLLVDMKAERLVDGILANTEQAIRQSVAAKLQGQRLTAAQQHFMDTVPSKLAQILRDEMPWSKLRPLYAQIYRESLTQEDVDGLIAFYTSPAGAAMLDKMPLVMQKAQALTMKLMPPVMEKMKVVLQQAVAEAKTAK